VIETQVLIVGAGPVGLSLAVDLGQRGIRTILVERKNAPAFLPKMSGSTRAPWKSTGAWDWQGRSAPPASRATSPWTSTLCSISPSHRYCASPTRRSPKRRRRSAATTDGSVPLEPYQLISQYTLEPLLKAEAEMLPPVSLRWSTEYLSHTQDDDGVTTTVRTPTGASETIRSAYLVGCDGGASAVRQTLAIRLFGEANLRGFRQGLYYSEDLFDKIPIGNGPGHGRHYHVADEEGTFLIMQDSTKYWTVHASVDSDAAMERQFEKTIGVPVNYKMLSCNPWRQNLLLAERYQDRRVFLAGDAVHLVIPDRRGLA